MKFIDFAFKLLPVYLKQKIGVSQYIFEEEFRNCYCVNLSGEQIHIIFGSVLHCCIKTVIT